MNSYKTTQEFRVECVRLSQVEVVLTEPPLCQSLLGQLLLGQSLKGLFSKSNSPQGLKAMLRSYLNTNLVVPKGLIL